MKPFDILKEGYGFVVITFSDNSKLVVCTTLNKKLLEDANVTCVKDYFYDFLKEKYVAFPKNAIDVSVYADDPHVREVDKFADRFI